MAKRIDAPPLRADARRNRARILEVAREVFASEGLAVPIDTVAARAGIGVGTVYRHFPTKEALFAAIVMDRVQELAADARSALADDDPGEAFYRFLRMLAERSATDMALADAFAAAGIDIKSSLGVCKQDLSAAIDDLLERAQAAGAVRPDVSVADVFALLSSTSIACGRQGLADASERLVGVVLDGLRPR
jgi:AcrR family transcriptional regulator